METTLKLHTFGWAQSKTYLCAGIFVAFNILLPQLCHLIPQGGIVLAPLSLVIMAGAYKFGTPAAAIAAILSPVTNNLLFASPASAALPVIIVKLLAIAVVAGEVARRWKRASAAVIAAVAAVSFVLGAAGELAITGGLSASAADITAGWPGLILQIVGTHLLINKVRL